MLFTYYFFIRLFLVLFFRNNFGSFFDVTVMCDLKKTFKNNFIIVVLLAYPADPNLYGYSYTSALCATNVLILLPKVMVAKYFTVLDMPSIFL